MFPPPGVKPIEHDPGSTCNGITHRHCTSFYVVVMQGWIVTCLFLAPRIQKLSGSLRLNAATCTAKCLRIRRFGVESVWKLQVMTIQKSFLKRRLSTSSCKWLLSSFSLRPRGSGFRSCDTQTKKPYIRCF